MSIQENLLLSPNNQIAFRYMIVGLFMAILDIQIVASSIEELQAPLMASLDEISWIQTSYLIAEVIVIPLTGWLAKAFSTRYFFTFSVIGFTLSSTLCAFAWDLQSMIIFRLIQGLFGGALIPTVFSIIYTIFPKKKQNGAMITAGLVATMAPTLGPTLGGWITTNFSWHWLFLINIIPGIVVSYGTYRFLNIDQPNHSLFKKFDYLGVLSIAAGFILLEVFLKNGYKYQWFDTNLIFYLFFGTIISFTVFIIQELTTTSPIVNLTVFRDKNFSIGCFLSFTIGVGLYGSIYLIPLMLGVVHNYNSLQIGMFMCVTGLFQFISGPLAGKACQYFDLRYVLAIGLLGMGLGILMDGYLTINSCGNDILVSQILRGLAIMFCFLPITNISLGKLSLDQIQNASGLFNLMRNLGGAIGIAIIDTILNSRINFHNAYLREHLSALKLHSIHGIHSGNSFTNYQSDPLLLKKINLLTLQSRVSQQAVVLGFNDIFMYVGTFLILCISLLFFIGPVKFDSENQASH